MVRYLQELYNQSAKQPSRHECELDIRRKSSLWHGRDGTGTSWTASWNTSADRTGDRGKAQSSVGASGARETGVINSDADRVQNLVKCTQGTNKKAGKYEI